MSKLEMPPGYQAEPEPPKAHQALTAFLVIIEEDERAWVSPDVNLDLVLARFPSGHEVYGAVKSLARDMEADAAAQRVLGAMQSMGQAMASQQAHAATLGHLGDLRKGV